MTTPEVIGRVEHIAFHPVKSAGALEVPQARLTPEGIAGDREFMIVRSIPNEDGIFEFITQRDKRDREDRPQGLSDLALIKPRMSGAHLVLTWAGENPIGIPKDLKGTELPVQIWNDLVLAVDQGDTIAEWLSDHLRLATRLVRATGNFQRDARQNYIPNDNTVRFQDGYPIHWFFEESVDELSQRAGETIPWQAFRPNLVATGSPAQTEHVVYSGEINGIPFIDPKPCDRCPVTNVDQETGGVKPGRALRALASYKRWANKDGEQKVIFGENMLPFGTGNIKVGDEIVLMERRSPELAYGAKI